MRKNNFFKTCVTALIFTLCAQIALAKESKIIVESDPISLNKTRSSHLYDTAIIQGLNKITAKTSALEIKIGDQIRFGQIIIIAHKCWKASLDQTPESKILLEIFEIKEDIPTKIFYGWMFASSPSISGLEHPIYDLTAIGCINK